ncbi:hypothetical protein CEUSTIGMA_g1912.t1 [Chlamydomonas eustigma]|uniref:Uncharacterized protein n=1 Tax=Chlamydomonas eustigma TaxID=1157962 RepID=A0A250WUF5_9CHLO|nr:hypothetical protein CEUSTIGMA_g1912.t1 [Chlamydomonas eustigma]|eukprot:GAX74463.1 hypothetical protein CEUSTIGMA_g1912.t1 [Chlamydomonas eustigma]
MSESHNRFVGRNKTKASKESTSSWGNASSLRESADDMSTWYKEFEEWTNPSFNVLMVQAPRPAFLESDLLNALRATVRETGELLKPLLRFGVPETSVRDKCPYWRDDNSVVPTTPSVRLQRAFKVMESQSEHHHLQSKHGGHGHSSIRHSGDVGSVSWHGSVHPLAGGHVHGEGGSPISSQKFLMQEPPPWIVLGLNMMAWWILSTPPKPRTNVI